MYSTIDVDYVKLDAVNNYIIKAPCERRVLLWEVFRQHFVPYRTGAESYMDFYLDDGRIVRFTYEDFPSGINPEGKIGDLIEDLLYFGWNYFGKNSESRKE